MSPRVGRCRVCGKHAPLIPAPFEPGGVVMGRHVGAVLALACLGVGTTPERGR